MTIKRLSAIQNKLKAIAKLVKALREVDSVAFTLNEFIKPKYFFRLLRMVQNYQHSQRQLSTFVRHLAVLKCAEAISTDNSENRAEAEEFLQLYYSHWSESIEELLLQKSSVKDKSVKRMSQAFLEDFKRFSDYVNGELLTLHRQLSENLERVKKIVLVALVLLNEVRLMSVPAISVREYRKAKQVHSAKERELKHPELKKDQKK